MAFREAQASLLTARDAVDEAVHLMESPRPDVLERSAECLKRACEELRRAREGLGEFRGKEELAAVAGGIRGGVMEASRRLGFVHDYHARWNQVLGVLTGGYDPGGKAAAVVRPATVLARG
jgi:hypothetical protein